MATQNPFQLDYKRPASVASQPSSGAYPSSAFQGTDPSNYTLNTGSAQRQPYTGTLSGGNARPQAQTATQQTPTSYAGSAFSGAANPWAPPSPLQDPGDNLQNPGYDEQALLYSQNMLLNDPYANAMQGFVNQASSPSTGQNFMNQNLGSLAGPGQGQQYWQQMQGQYTNPFAGEQFAHDATANFAAQGPASAFYNQAMGQYGDFTGYTGPQNAQGQYGMSQQQLGNGTMGQQNMSQIAGQYGSIGQYSDPNLAAGQYAQTQGAFGDLPIANFDPFFDRARQLGVQSYNQGAAGRGVYGSSEALSGVGNVITDIEAQRALKGFDAEMQREQALQGRQKLLGEQARMGDLSSLAAFGANLSGVETFGNLNNQMGQLQNESQSILGQMANNADSQALGAQNANISGLNAFGNLASSADSAETGRYTASTNAMNNADRTQLDRINSGADVAFRADDAERADYTAEMGAAQGASQADQAQTRLGADIASTASRNDLARVEAFNNAAGNAESSRQARKAMELDSVRQLTRDVQSLIGEGMARIIGGSQEDFENWFNAEIQPALQAAGYDQQQRDSLRKDLETAAQIGETASGVSNKGSKAGG